MKIECIKEKLHNAVSILDKTSSKNQNLPILTCILIDASNNTLRMRTTNLDMGVEINIPAKIISAGTVAVPSNVFLSAISNILTDRNVVIESRDNNLFISSQKTSTLIKCLPFEDFPSLPYIEEGKDFSINGKDFVHGLKAVSYSASVSSIKPELNSVYVYENNGYLYFVATDSFRLAEKMVKVDKMNSGDAFLIPQKNASELIRVFEDINDNIKVTYDKNQVSFEYENIYVVSRLINGLFPDYKQIIPKSFLCEAVVLKQDIINSLKLSSVFSDKSFTVNINVDPKHQSFKISTKNADIGENNSVLPGSFSGDSVISNFNYKYISECFSAIPSESVSMGFNGPQKPVIIRGVSDNSFTYLVMPMNR